MWTKSPDTDLTDWRLLEAGPLGHHLYHRAAIFMSANLTKGRISHRALRSLDDFAGITEDGKQVTLAGLAARLVKLELWQVEDDGYYDLRHEGRDPADLIEKRRVAGKLGGLSSAEVRRQKYGTAQPLRPEANEASLERVIEPKPRSKTPKHLEAVPVPVDIVSKSPDQLNGQDNSRGQDLDVDVLDHVGHDAPAVAVSDDNDDAQLPEPSVVELTAPQDVPDVGPKLSIRQRFYRRRVRTHIHGDGAVLTVNGNEIVVKLDRDGDPRRYYAADLEVIPDVEKFAENDLVETPLGPGEVVDVLPGDRYMVFLADGTCVVFPAIELKRLVAA